MIPNHLEPYFWDPSTGFVYKDMYDIKPIPSPPESSKASCILPRLYELLLSPVHLVALPPLHIPLLIKAAY
jgi:hypothetical protein